MKVVIIILCSIIILTNTLLLIFVKKSKSSKTVPIPTTTTTIPIPTTTTVNCEILEDQSTSEYCSENVRLNPNYCDDETNFIGCTFTCSGCKSKDTIISSCRMDNNEIWHYCNDVKTKKWILSDNMLSNFTPEKAIENCNSYTLSSDNNNPCIQKESTTTTPERKPTPSPRFFRGVTNQQTTLLPTLDKNPGDDTKFICKAINKVSHLEPGSPYNWKYRNRLLMLEDCIENVGNFKEDCPNTCYYLEKVYGDDIKLKQDKKTPEILLYISIPIIVICKLMIIFVLIKK